MAREIRITVDDEEVFERLKHRKDRLDLSWEDVLRRGLRLRKGSRSHGRWHRHWGRSPHGSMSAKGCRHRRRGQHWRRPESESEIAPDYEEPDQDLDHERDEPGVDVEIADLEEAEDAVLVFDFLADADDPSRQVPLRVSLQASSEGLAIEVAAIRRGKSVSGMNRFTSAERKHIVQALARGEAAVLRLSDDEEYAAQPVLSWHSDTDGRPAVIAIDLPDVILED